MRLVVDANILVAELLRVRGKALIAHPALQLVIAEYVWDEVRHELRKRLIAMARDHGAPDDTADTLLDSTMHLAETHIAPVPRMAYDLHETVARGRIPRDPDDWHTVALALASNADIWTADADFLGCGIATWTTDTLLTHLAQMEGTHDG